jgi:hypothetical protein
MLNVRTQVQNTLHRVSFGYDEGDLDLLAEQFASDARMSMRIGHRESPDMIGPFEGRDEILKLHAEARQSQRDQRRHVLSNLILDEVSSAEVVATSYLILLSVADGKMTTLSSGWYRDRLREVDGRWLIQDRYLYLDLPY